MLLPFVLAAAMLAASPSQAPHAPEPVREAEARGAPSPVRVARLLNSVGRKAARHPAYLRVDGRPVVVVDMSSRDGCAEVAKWVRVNDGWSHLVVEGVRRASRCRPRPAGWYASPPRGGSRGGRAPPRPRRPLVLVPAMSPASAPRCARSRPRGRTGTSSPASTSGEAAARSKPGARAEVLVAAGDIACSPSSTAFNDGHGQGERCRQAATAQMAAGADAVVTLGDNQWSALNDAGVELVLAGHDHAYERFAPQDPQGVADPVRGIRSFVVGTGGHSLRAFETARPNSEIRIADAFGVLRLELRSGGYAWGFVDIGGSVRDRGSARCH